MCILGESLEAILRVSNVLLWPEDWGIGVPSIWFAEDRHLVKVLVVSSELLVCTPRLKRVKPCGDMAQEGVPHTGKDASLSKEKEFQDCLPCRIVGT